MGDRVNKTALVPVAVFGALMTFSTASKAKDSVTYLPPGRGPVQYLTTAGVGYFQGGYNGSNSEEPS